MASRSTSLATTRTPARAASPTARAEVSKRAAPQRDVARPDVPFVPRGAPQTQGLSLTQQAYAEIKHRIITLGFRPGEFLNESTICQLLDIGRTPVHEALHLLKLEGLVEIIPRKGVLIRPDSLNDVISLLEARMIIEPQCMGLAAERAQAHHLAVLEELLRQTRQAIESGDRVHFMALDSQFHDELVNAAGNTMLGDVMRLLHQRASRIWHLQVWSDDDLKLTKLEHEAIFDAVQRGDRVAAVSTAQIHLTSLKRRILNRAS